MQQAVHDIFPLQRFCEEGCLQNWPAPRTVNRSLEAPASRLERFSPALQTGLVCFNQGYGIAAVAYFRRVVEERTDELIDVVAELAVASGVEEAAVAKITAAKAQRTYEKKLEVASQMIPASLRPGGVNPLGRLHSLLSEALHSRPEDESIKVADELRFIIEHVFSNLKEYIDAQRAYAAKIQNAGRTADPAAGNEKKA